MSDPRPVEIGERRVSPVAVTPVRAAATHRSERVTDLLLGEIAEVAALDGGWARVRLPDGYRGWIPARPLVRATVDPGRWESRARLFSLGAGAKGDASRGGGRGGGADAVDPGRERSLARLPWGARVVPREGGEVGLPDGSTVGIDRERLIEPPAVPPRDAGRAAVGLAKRWLRVPYVWGGRTELGVDCSGFVQAVFAALGVRLPRDSREQAVSGAVIAIDGGADVEIEAGDLLFFAPEGREITHVALSMGGRRILHAASSNGRVAIDDLAGDGWLERLLAGSLVASRRVASGG